MSNLNKKAVEHTVVPANDDKGLKVVHNDNKLTESPKQAKAVERIGKLEQFNALTKRYTTLIEKRQGIKKFLAGSDNGSKMKLTVESDGEKFEAENPTVILTILRECEQTIEKLIDEAEEKIEKFEI
jgi:hypothetical protein